MNLPIRTHIASNAGFCRCCGLPLPLPVEKGQATPIFAGERIAVIETKCIAPVSYRPGENDSNSICTK